MPKESEIIEEPEPKIEYEEINFNSNNLKNQLLNLIEKNEEDLGITLEEIKIQLHSDLVSINKILEELLKEGQIYLINNKYRLLL